MVQKEKSQEGERTCIKSTGFCAMGDGSNVAAIDSRNDKIVRIRPLHYDWRYKPEEFGRWKLKARGKVFQSPVKTALPPHALAYKKRIYSPNRILYPLKRVDWDPDGERNPQNRGKTGYARISWDEATDIIAKEIRRIIQKYESYAILGQVDGHGETKVVHGTHGCSHRLLEILGGYTQQLRNPDSWEGWWWGAKHVWGCEPVGTMSCYQSNVYQDIAKNTDMLLFQGGDPETTPWGFAGGQMPSLFCYWYAELGIKQIYICPDLNYGAAVHADKWIPILPNTDAALQLAIAYQWITQGTYDKDYVATHTVGFDKFKEYVLGKEDGVAKTPIWAAEKTGVPSRIIKALAREWASKNTTVAHGFGGSYIRGPYSTEPARLEVFLLAMQGLGKPGVHQVCFNDLTRTLCSAVHEDMGGSVPAGVMNARIRAAYRGHNAGMPMQRQAIPQTMVHDAILTGSFSIYGSSYQFLPVEDQFKKYVYPVPGCSEIHMIWTDAPCMTTCWNDSNRVVEAYRSPKIEFILAQHPWLENDCLLADIILPTNTKYEEEDIGDDPMSCQFASVFLEEKCMEPIGESKSDYEAVCAVAKKLGLLEEYTEGKSVEEWIKHGFDTSGLAEAGLCTWEELKEKKYYVIPTDPEWEKKYRAGMIDFYEDPEKHPLSTPSGKIEFYSERLAEHFPDDEERPPVPHWIEKGESHDERLSSERAKRYPLLIVSNHPRWRVHANLDDVTWFREIPTCKVKGPDGYHYEPVWINPVDAAERGIEDEEVVRVYNERGGVLGGAYVTERIMPGVVYMDHGARYDPIVPGELDRGGAINTITPHKATSKNAAGMATSGFLVEVERVNSEELRKKYPEAFERPYHAACGLRMERVLYGGEQK